MIPPEEKNGTEQIVAPDVALVRLVELFRAGELFAMLPFLAQCYAGELSVISILPKEEPVHGNPEHFGNAVQLLR